MSKFFSDNFEQIANDMGIALYTRFTIKDTCLFLRISEEELQSLIQKNKINYVNSSEIAFFGYQLIEYLLSTTTQNIINNPTDKVDRIIRIKELTDMVGLSRTTIWRMENYGSFPKRISLGVNSVGLKLNEVNEWLKNK